MAEKEERIRVLIAKNPCNECSVKKCTRKCTFGLLFEKAPGITRQEAIERMAKALYAHTWKSKTPMVRVQNWEIGVTDQNKKKYLGLAEAALNALLEGK
jgi:hypothetical protein